MPELPETAHFTLVPDRMCEVQPRPARKVDLLEKRPVYGRKCVAHLQLVELADRTLKAFDLRDGKRVLIAEAKDGEAVAIPPFDAVTFRLGDVWK